jgi:DNA polymerase III epsilon subunit-like protein
MEPTVRDLAEILRPGELYAIDLETTGLNSDDTSVKIIGVGLASVAGCYYIDLQQSTPMFKRVLWQMLAKVKLVAHNMVFDLGFLQRDARCELQPVGCTLVLYKMLAAEGWNGQRWGLDVAIEDILGWPDSNKDVLADLLAQHGLSSAS